MLDPYVRPLIDPPLNYVGAKLAKQGVTSNIITLFGFMVGIFAMIMIGFEHYLIAAYLLVCNRVCDGLDGAVARHSKLTDFGGFIDIVCDFIIYGGVVFAFCLTDPSRANPGAFLIFSFIGPITSFLAYATLAAKKNIQCLKRGQKSFYYLGGICEGTETAFVLILMCLAPEIFTEICIVYGVLCWITTGGRVYQAWTDFGKESL